MHAGYSNERLKIILNWIGSNKKVLDLGCFDGRDSMKIKKNGNIVYAIEIDKISANKAKKRGIIVSNINLENKKGWGYRNKYFDLTKFFIINFSSMIK